MVRNVLHRRLQCAGALPLTFSVPTELPPVNSTESQQNGGKVKPEAAATAGIKIQPLNTIRQLGMKPGSAFSAAGNSHQQVSLIQQHWRSVFVTRV